MPETTAALTSRDGSPSEPSARPAGSQRPPAATTGATRPWHTISSTAHRPGDYLLPRRTQHVRPDEIKPAAGEAAHSQHRLHQRPLRPAAPLRRVGRWPRTTSIDDLTLGEGEGQEERAPSRRSGRSGKRTQPMRWPLITVFYVKKSEPCTAQKPEQRSELPVYTRRSR